MGVAIVALRRVLVCWGFWAIGGAFGIGRTLERLAERRTRSFWKLLGVSREYCVEQEAQLLTVVHVCCERRAVRESGKGVERGGLGCGMM